MTISKFQLPATRILVLLGAIAILTATVAYIANRSQIVANAKTQPAAQTRKELLSDTQTTGFRCSAMTLRGRFAVRNDGFVPSGPPPTPMVPFADVSLMTFDGEGSLIDDATASQNGFIIQNVNQGSYTLGENCKGTMSINIPTPPFELDFNIVVANNGKLIYFISTTPSVVTGEGTSVE